MFDVYSTLYQSDIPCSKGERLFRGEIKYIQIGGASPRRMQVGGASPRGEWSFAIDVKGGVVNHIDVIDVY
jgi:hypothetical protein